MEINNTIPVINHVDLDGMLQNRRLKSQRIKDQQKEGVQLAETNKIENNEISYMLESNIVKSSDFEVKMLEDTPLSQQINMEAEVTQIELKELAEYQSKYITRDKLSEIMKYFDKESGVSLEEIDNLYNKMNSGSEESAEVLLDSFFKNKKPSNAQIYTILLYLFDQFSATNSKKERLLKLLKDLLNSLETQQSGSLFRFFSLLNNPSVRKNIGLASFLSNNTAIRSDNTSLKQVVGFVRQNLSNSYDNLVSNLMRCRMELLENMDMDNLSFEDKTKLADFVSFEKNIQLVSSLYFCLAKFSEDVAKNKINRLNLLDDYSILITATLNFSEVAMVNDASINMLLQYYTGTNDLSNKTVGTINLLINLFSQLPMPIFANQQAQKVKLIEGFRNIIKILLKQENNKSSQNRRFDFISSGKKSVEYI